MRILSDQELNTNEKKKKSYYLVCLYFRFSNKLNDYLYIYNTIPCFSR